MAAKCKTCRKTYLPPRLYCEECFGELGEWTSVKPEGEIYSYTLAHVSADGTRLKESRIIAFIRFDGVHGGLIHVIDRVEKNRVKIGMRVKPRSLPGERPARSPSSPARRPSRTSCSQRQSTGPQARSCWREPAFHRSRRCGLR